MQPWDLSARVLVVSQTHIRIAVLAFATLSILHLLTVATGNGGTTVESPLLQISREALARKKQLVPGKNVLGGWSLSVLGVIRRNIMSSYMKLARQREEVRMSSDGSSESM
ncbi:hypothetical protein ASPBRDRAFT_43156 [Aspergillus brasiliensis CBS 101740]|uniref:Uncharacterized protein n=1 Tax=Aspergillus brasiliensis (strain CBS 101740 / IMI 381727 / IBT 21946) TaxID=767769 RepID=A0A1L9UJK2_ASPBC|nr:hypothetical protein ASPBRDRAFT_43156 [Aspergillus brasiliensis CBS 101740]